MATPVPIARVSAVQGQAFARGEDGRMRQLHVGDLIFEGDVIVTAQNSAVDLATQGGSPFKIGADEHVAMDAEALGQTGAAPDAADSAVNVSGDDFSRIVTALNQGENLDALLEETAAGTGGAGGEAGGGPTFVRLLRITESVEPLSYEFGTARQDVLDYPLNGGRDDQDPGPELEIPDVNNTPNGPVAGNVSVPENETTEGSFVIRSPDGLDPDNALNIGGTTISEAELIDSGNNPIVIDTPEGELIIDGYNPDTGEVRWKYDPDGDHKDHSNGDVLDDIPIIVTDSDGDTSEGHLVINITDTEPDAVDDANSVTEDGPITVTGNVTGNDDPSADDPCNVTNVNGVDVPPGGVTIPGEHGDLTIYPDGSYEYTLHNDDPDVNALKDGQTIDDTFTYTYTDSDGDSDNANLVITINGHTDGPPSIVPNDHNSPGDTDGHNTVWEQGLVDTADPSETATGSIQITAPDGLASVTIGGTTLTADELAALSPTSPVTIDTGEGTLTLTHFDPTTGELDYTYTLKGPIDQANGTDSFDDIPLHVTDMGGDTADGTLRIQIMDSAPEAKPDVNAVTEDGDTDGNPATSQTASGNVITTTPGDDTLGADATTVTGIAKDGDPETAVSGPTTVHGEYGDLTINPDGSYTYVLNNDDPRVQALTPDDPAHQSLEDKFTYTITDSDGDTSTTTITITINGTDDAPTITVPDNNDEGATVVDGNESVPEDSTTGIDGTFTIKSPDGFDDPDHPFSINGTPVDVADIGTGSGTAVITTPDGTLTITAYDPDTGEVSWHYVPNGAKDHDPDQDGTEDPVLDDFIIEVTDADGDTTQGHLVINITDTEPDAEPDTNAVTKGGADETALDDGDPDTTIISGNVIDNDTQNIDGPSAGGWITGVEAGDTTGGGTPITDGTGLGGTGIVGDYGTLILNPDGSYTYILDNTNTDVAGLGSNDDPLKDVFTYTITDADGDSKTTTITITINGDGVPTIDIPDTNDDPVVTPGDASVP
ncbi:MAG: retention module-containing protein, partial [Candidatus Accumulibacter sp.]|nr:retention module-containing protein [Accumulibacter sp.]